MISYDNQSFDFKAPKPDKFALRLTHQETINCTYMKMITKHVLNTHNIEQRVVVNAKKNELFDSYLFIFIKKTGRKIG